MSLVLVVEDDVMFRASMARALHKLVDVDIVEAGTAEEAIKLVEGLPVDLLLCDLQLGDRTALEVLPHARRNGHGIPTILVSGAFHQFKNRLPNDLHLIEKPVAVGALRELVGKLLGRTDRTAPFSLADYIQLASFGRHSVELSIAHSDGEHAGTVIVRDGQAWSASDPLGEGMEAFLRLVTITDATLSASQPARGATARNLHGPCEALLMEAARLVDERRANRPPPKKTVTLPPVPAAPPMVMKIPPKPPVPAPPARTELARGTRDAVTREAALREREASTPPPRPANNDTRDFDRLYEAGIDALLNKRYAEACTLLSEARAIKTTPTLEANLQRLRTLGFS